MDEITVVGGGIAGLSAAIAAAEGGAPVRLLEAGSEVGGRARSIDGPYRANLGPHVLYKDGAPWAWLSERGLLPPTNGLPLGSMRLRHRGSLRRTPPASTIPAVLKLRGRKAPHDVAFREWAARHAGAENAELLARGAGVYTFHHDPGELSAAFIWSAPSAPSSLRRRPCVMSWAAGTTTWTPSCEARASSGSRSKPERTWTRCPLEW